MKLSFSRIRTLTARNLKEISRDPLSVIFMIGLPLLMELLFYYLFHGMTSQFEMRYLAPGIVVFSQAFLALFAGILISLDRASSFLTRLFVSSARPGEYIFSYAFSLIPLSLVQSVLFFLVGGVIDPSLFGVGMIRGILLSIVTSFLYIGLGILFGSLCGERSVGGVASIVISCQSLLSGMWFPTEGLSDGMLTLMKCLPFKNATDLIQNALNGINDSFEDFFKPLVIVLAYSAAVTVLATVCFRAKMKEK